MDAACVQMPSPLTGPHALEWIRQVGLEKTNKDLAQLFDPKNIILKQSAKLRLLLFFFFFVPKWRLMIHDD